VIFQSADVLAERLRAHVREPARISGERSVSLSHETLPNEAEWPTRGRYADGFRPLAEQFAAHFARGEEIGAGLVVYQHGRCVVDLQGGWADAEARVPWRTDTRLVVFSVTKGFAAMALNLLADRGQLEWDAPVATYWPEFAAGGKGRVTVAQLFQHQAGLPYLDVPLTLDDCIEDRPVVDHALAGQRPAWTPGEGSGYHPVTFGMYAQALFRRITRRSSGPEETIGAFLRRELFEPLGSDVHMGTPASLDGRTAKLYPPSNGTRLRNALREVALRPNGTDGRVARELFARGSLARRAFVNPSVGPRGLLAYNEPPARRADLPWASATASAHGVARAYLPWAAGGVHDGRRYVSAATVAALYGRGSWSERDRVLQKPLGWTRGFLKDEVFSPQRASFGHAGMGGALGWADPVAGLTFGYVMNAMDWRVRSSRALALCRALYACEPVRAAS
jgi:CubicO group peptidase (beta-lactamase class C family)